MRKDGSPEGDTPASDHQGAGSGAEKAAFFVVFTDLDGTLLDHNTYEWRDAGPALNLCRRLGAPVVLVSSKTRAEMDRLRIRMGLHSPFVSENGGGIFFPVSGCAWPPGDAMREGDLWKWSLGIPYEGLLGVLRDLRKETGLPIRGFSDMGIEEISRLTGLDPDTARLAAQREFDEPLILEDPRGAGLDLLRNAAAARGLTLSEGGRFHHLHGGGDKGEAVDRLIAWYREEYPHLLSVAMGDSPNDFPMLERADIPVLVRSDRDPKGLEQRIPGLRITREKGPRGWNRAVLDILHGKRMEGVSRDV
ncbi:MAG: HAD-IIB family hydrolase [Deltaproteobacteria bacterium]|nr:HAD-IIB family hydrolase [Deltaproteobacteria bacterium]